MPPPQKQQENRAKTARYRADSWAAAPGRVVGAVGIGLLVLGIGTYWGTMTLQRELVEDALAEQGRAVEDHIEALIERYSVKSESLADLGSRLVRAAEVHPAIRDLVIADDARRIVARYPRDAGRLPCLPVRPAGAAVRHEHSAGELETAPVACTMLPVKLADDSSGVVLFHAVRDWRMEGARAQRWLMATTRRLAPLFAAFYLLLAGLLFCAARAAQRWRRRAESAGRVQALGALAAGINHEIKNPLNTVGLSLQYLARRHDDPETREVVASAEREAIRIGETLDEFVRFTRVSRLDTREVSLREQVAACNGREAAGGDGPVSIDGDARVRIDVDKMRDALAAILGPIWSGPVEVTLTGRRDRWTVVVRGRPSDPELAVDRLFDPYVRPRPRDIGRGLALARAVFQAHGGDLDGRLKGEWLVLKGEALKTPVSSESQ